MTKHAGRIPAVGLATLLWLLPQIGAADEGCPCNGDLQTPGVSPGEVNSLTGPAASIVNLKPGDVRLFAPSTSTPGRLHRWFDLQAASVGLQYIFAKNGSGVAIANQQQYQVAMRGRFKLDPKDRFAIIAGLSTGATFIAGFNNTGLGLATAQSNLYLKHLYLSARPLDGIEVQYGGLDVWHDESTDITGYGYNGYVIGERISIKRPRELFFDDISIGYGYFGDFNIPNFMRRADRLTQSNFHRFILRKDISERAWVSADYAYQAGVPTWREAIRIRTTELRGVDTFHAEIYQVSGPHSGYGFASYVEKTVHPKFVVGVGYADIDRLMLNSDRYGRGKRLFLTAKIPINKALSVLLFATQATDHVVTNVPQQRLDIGLYYNAFELLRKTGLF